MSRSIISVAIIGGGLAGTILMNALMKYPQLDVQLYEANPEIKERGASIGLSVNAQRAMRLIGLGDVTKRAGAVTVGCLQLIVGEGSEAGDLVYNVDFGKETMHRAALLKELLVAIPSSNIHLNKRLSTIKDGRTLFFADGTSIAADVIIGADGIHSGVRKFVLVVNPVPSGFWDARAVVTHDEAVKKLGTACVNKIDPHQHVHIGSKGVLFHDIIDDGQRVCIVASGPVTSDWDISQWTHTVTRKWLDIQYMDWGQFGRDGLDLLFGDKTETSAFIQWESAVAPTFYNQTICMIGDAAHAMSPWQGSGLSQAIEDSLVLERVLGQCRNAKEIPIALEVFDRIRRPHSQKVVESSRKAAEAYFNSHSGGAEQLRIDIPSRDYILNWDTEGAVNQATADFERLRAVQIAP